MSVLVFDGNSLSSDSQASNGQTLFPYPKIWTVDHRSLPKLGSAHTILAGAIGPLTAASKLREWVEGQMDPTKFPLSYVVNTDAQLVIVTKEHGLKRYTQSATPHLHGFNKIAIGEGAPFAYGALHWNHTAEEAVLSAIAYSPHCNGEAVTLSL